MITSEQISELSKRFSIDTSTIIREYMQLVFLSELYGRKESQHVYFKGGTAIHLLFGANRFSEDLDFNADMTVREASLLLDALVKQVDYLIPGTTLKKDDTGAKSCSGILSYMPERSKYPQTVRIDISLREKTRSFGDTVLQTVFPLGTAPVIRHMAWTEVCAEKICALMTRNKGRDVYDLWYLLSEGVEIDVALVNSKMHFYNKSFSMTDTLAFIESMTEKQLERDLQKFLPARDRGLALRVKQLLTEQLTARQHFTIRSSMHLDYTKDLNEFVWYSGGENLSPDPRGFVVTAVDRKHDHRLTVTLRNSDKQERQAQISSKDEVGDAQLFLVMKAPIQLSGLSYEAFLGFDFGMM